MHRPLRIITFSALVIATLSACAGSDDRFPSLAIRDVERMDRMESDTRPSASASSDPTYAVSTTKIEDALERARVSHRQFITSQPDAEKLARNATGRSIGDDLHSRALIALADLTILRSRTVGALADLDQLEARGATLFAPIDAVQSAQIEVAGLIREQNSALDTLVRELDR